ncbi:MAG: phosphatidate cytidylyltransferase [Rikenellaceae bacterium]|nr:phosphatidate cytidylyltransferase [Rikenellaceae bacterium]
MNQLLVRSLGGIIVVAAIGASVLSSWGLLVVALLITAGSMLEVYTIAQKKGIFPDKILPIGLGLLAIASMWFSNSYTLTLCILMSILPLVAILELYRNRTTPLENIFTSVGNVIYIVVPMMMLVMFRNYDKWFFLTYFITVWTNDVGAYLVGMTLGKHRLFERISPKKSWEGFFGGLFFSIGVAVGAGYLLHNEVSLWWAGFGAIVCIAGVFGDLIESMFKRAVQMKDSGSVIPGHGGFLDRFDAVFISAPIVFVYLFVTNQFLF